MNPLTFRLLLVVVPGASTGEVTPSQRAEVPTVQLIAPAKVFPEGFSWLVTIRELRDGRVLALDQCETAVSVLDFSNSRVSLLATSGAGPLEVRSADRLDPFTGDSSLVYDSRNRRYLVVDPLGKPARTFAALPPLMERSGRAAVDRQLIMVGADSVGRVYGRPIGRRATPQGIVQEEFIPIARWNPQTGRRDTLGTFRVPMSGPRVDLLQPFLPITAFAVRKDGTLAIVYPSDYHVEFISPAGRRNVGAPNRWGRLSVTNEMKAQWRNDQRSICPSLASTERAVPFLDRGQMRVAKVIPPREPKTWPNSVPPFPRSAARYAPDGTLWVRRTVESTQPPTYDLIDSTGAVKGRVFLKAGATLVGFGRNFIYLAVRDSVDLHRLEAYPTTAIPRL